VTETRLSPDQCAKRAYYAAFFSCFFPPIAVITVYWFARAVESRRENPPENMRKFRKRMYIAFFFGILLPPCATVAILLALG